MLCKLVLKSLPIYFLSVSKIPVIVARKLEVFPIIFFWLGSFEQERGWHNICWGRVCTSKETGCLGIKNIGDFFLAVLCKWLWRLGSVPMVSGVIWL